MTTGCCARRRSASSASGTRPRHVQQRGTAVPGFVLDSAQRIGYSIITLPARVYDLGVSTFGGTERDPEGIIGVVGIGRLAGEITSLDTCRSPTGRRVCSDCSAA